MPGTPPRPRRRACTRRPSCAFRRRPSRPPRAITQTTREPSFRTSLSSLSRQEKRTDTENIPWHRVRWLVLALSVSGGSVAFKHRGTLRHRLHFVSRSAQGEVESWTHAPTSVVAFVRHGEEHDRLELGGEFSPGLWHLIEPLGEGIHEQGPRRRGPRARQPLPPQPPAPVLACLGRAAGEKDQLSNGIGRAHRNPPAPSTPDFGFGARLRRPPHRWDRGPPLPCTPRRRRASGRGSPAPARAAAIPAAARGGASRRFRGFRGAPPDRGPGTAPLRPGATQKRRPRGVLPGAPRPRLRPSA